MAEKKKKKKGGLFWKIYAIVLLLVTIGIGVLAIVGYDLMMDYDESQTYALKYSNEIAEQFKEGNFDILFGDYSTISVPMVFEKDEYIASLNEKVSDAEVFARKGYSKDRYENPVYDIIAGSEKIASLQFKKTGETSKYGFAEFELEKVTPNVKGSYAVSVLVPTGASITLNGKKFEDSLWTSVTEEEDGKVYTIEGLMNEPKIDVTYDTGEAATLVYNEERGVWYAKLYSVTFTVPSGSTVKLNGQTVTDTDQYIVKKDIAVDAVKTSLKYVTADVTYTKYTVTGLTTLEGVTIEGTDFMGHALTFTYDEDTNEYSAEIVHDTGALSYYGVEQSFIMKIAEEYAKFIMNDGDRWANLLPYVYKDSELYDMFDEFWVVFTPHNYYWFDNEEFFDLTCYSDNLFSARVKLEYWIQGYNHKTDNVNSYDVDVTFFYAKINGQWLAVDFTLEGEES